MTRSGCKTSYGGISEEELLQAIGSMTFDNGDTLTVVGGPEKKNPVMTRKNVSKALAKRYEEQHQGD